MRVETWYQQFIKINEREDLLWFAGIILTGFLIKTLCSGFLSRQFFRFFRRFSNGQYLDIFVKLLKKPFEYFIIILTFIVAFDRLVVPPGWILKIGRTLLPFADICIDLGKLAVTLSVIWILLRSADYVAYIFSERSRSEGDANDVQLAKFLKDIIKVFILASGILFLLGAVFGLNVTSLITGLGIGGLAIALAAQETIANLIGSFVIFLDKPFAVGDIIESEKIRGVIESVGFRSTRIRTPDKTLLTVPNKKLVDAALNNLTRTGTRRVKMVLSFALSSPLSEVRKFILEMENDIRNHPDTTDQQQVLLADITEHALQVSIICFVVSNDPDYVAMVKQDLNYKALEAALKYHLTLAAIDVIVRNEP